MRQGGKNYSAMGHRLLLNLTCDIEENQQQGYATLPFLKKTTTGRSDSVGMWL